MRRAAARSVLLALTIVAPLPAHAVIVAGGGSSATDCMAVFDAAGNEVVVWEGQDPTTGDRGVLVIPVKESVTTNRVKIYLNSPAVPGWNEIDAVGLMGNQGNTVWASAATASSTYASEVAPATPRVEFRVRQLER